MVDLRAAGDPGHSVSQQRVFGDLSRPVSSAVINGVPVVATPAEIDTTNADGLRVALSKAAAIRPGTIVVDMTRTQFCDSSGLHTLPRISEPEPTTVSSCWSCPAPPSCGSSPSPVWTR